jgi:hypothetical protein
VTYADCTALLAGSENDSQIWRVPLPPEATPGCDGGTEPPADELKLAAPGPQSCRSNQACAIQLTATGGKPPLTYSATGLPLGLTADPAGGWIGDKSWQTGTFRITAAVTDSASARTAVQFPLTINWF